ncbi:hypothetical protein [Vibrio sp. Hep-1b-8]|uniref:hypothetical protein n=1 Tax=Vibrio sp. Hep-1b-8 TaxID=2144187 RepID=UPI001485F892|nr:hypothetical protein [Vibrio sp. Hep-1b-8]
MPIAILVTAQYQLGLWHNNLRLRCLTYMGFNPSNGQLLPAPIILLVLIIAS